MGFLDLIKSAFKGSGSRKGPKQQCPGCNETITLDMERCPKCGVRIKSMFRRKCPKCQTLNELDIKRCVKCNYDFEAELARARQTHYRCPICGYRMETFFPRCPACNTRFM